MTNTTFDALLSRNADRIFRTLGGGGVFIAPTTVAVPTAITAGAGATLQTLPVGYIPLGWMDPDGLQYDRNLDSSDVNGWGASEPVRTDIVKDQETVKFTVLETSVVAIGLDLGLDWTAFAATAVTGELIVKKPAVAPNPYYRLMQLARDQKNETYFARCYPRAQITAREGQQYAGGDAKVAYTHTWASFYDSTELTAVKYFYGGPGWLALLDDLGLDAGSSSS